MSLINNLGHYLKITDIQYRHTPTDNEMAVIIITCDIYPSQAARQNGFADFECGKRDIVETTSMNYVCDPQKTLRDNMLTGSYTALKNLPEYAGWVDA